MRTVRRLQGKRISISVRHIAVFREASFTLQPAQKLTENTPSSFPKVSLTDVGCDNTSTPLACQYRPDRIPRFSVGLFVSFGLFNPSHGTSSFAEGQ
jgi:hypothetical protein